ncbi:putative hydrolase of the HAD superfamily [Hamadaea flava]|uniref:HAD family hydrolase n=1 Tax=Hamadaea flava TaxID=1742688 RepID=A0ABV8LRQ1_9ACTN|nr:HAD family phosphatase [Hamadaea flava]MCP2327274.1 putative hydrolase of the HAD superfamily [Hamadaea flava]
MAIRAVVFDIGGILELSAPEGFDPVDQKWAARWGLEPVELNGRLRDIWARGAIGLITEAEVVAGIAEGTGTSVAEAEGFMSDIWTVYLGTPNAELTAYFEGLHQRYLTGLISNSFVGAREREAALYRYPEMTDDIVYSHECGIAKPDPRIYQLACERLDVRPDEVVYLDDVERCVAGAAAIGMHAVHYSATATAMAEIDALLAAYPGGGRD